MDVRDAHAQPREAEVALVGTDGTRRRAARVGEVYVADGVVPGEYSVEVQGAGEWQGAKRVKVRERLVAGVVVLLASPPDGKRRRGEAAAGLMRGDEPDCDAAGGVLVGALAFVRDRPAAGRMEVRGSVKGQRGKLLCTVGIAGGTAEVRLAPGEYFIAAQFVGGGRVEAFYRLLADRPPPPLALRIK